jgi:microcystin degradation protein MlrC
MTKLFIACLGTETNTLVPFPTGKQAFAGREQFRGDATKHPATTFTAPLHVWRARAEALGWQVSEGLATFAQPSGVTVKAVYESLRDELLGNLRDAMPVDVVLLSLHGAMVAEGYDDCEGDLLRRVREMVGPAVVVGAELDPHCHLTAAMLDAATHLVMFKEYPHIDSALRAEEVFSIAKDTLAGRVKPVMAMFDCRMLGVFRTPVEPMKSFVARMQSLEGHNGILSVSLGHSFPWADVEDVGVRTLVVTNGDAGAAAMLAEQLGRELFAIREQTVTALITPDQLVDAVFAAPPGPPIVAADTADNAGGGSPSDATFILQTLLKRNVGRAGRVLVALMWDPMAFAIAEEAGEGATLMMRLGGKSGALSGDPVDLKVTVRQLAYDGRQSFGKSAKAATGNLAWLQTEQGIDIVVNTTRTQLFDPDAFEKLGLDCSSYRLIVVKSTQHFYAGFAPIASQVLYVTAPGGVMVDFVNLPLTRRKLPYWPKTADPFAA